MDKPQSIATGSTRDGRVKDHMTRDVITIDPSESCQKALMMMHSAGINHLPVVERSRLVGILTERDIHRRAPELRRSAEAGSRKRLLSLVNVGGVMTYAPATVSSQTSLREALDVMLKRRIGCLPVMRKGHLVGIFTTRDAMGVLTGASAQSERTKEAGHGTACDGKHSASR